MTVLTLTKTADVFQLSTGQKVSKSNLFHLIKDSKDENSESWSGLENKIANTPQQGINWIGNFPNLGGVIVKSKAELYGSDAWQGEARNKYQYSLKASKGVVKLDEKANQCLINQPLHNYPVFLFSDAGDNWEFQGEFSVSDVGDAAVTLKRRAPLSKTLASIKPVTKERVIDLVEKAGFDISDWANYNGNASQNPNYCYEWSFSDPHKGVILNLWFPDFLEKDGKIVSERNFREDAKHLKKSQWRARAQKMDSAVRSAWENKRPVQVIILDGEMRAVEDEDPAKPSVRSLDDEFWHVAEYDVGSGRFQLIRGAAYNAVFADQFDQPPEGSDSPESKSVASRVYPRDPRIRNWVLDRAQGKCEFCGQKGFTTKAGKIYLETHHVIALCDGGPDVVTNVIALCPNDHRQAHFGEYKEQMKLELLSKISG